MAHTMQVYATGIYFISWKRSIKIIGTTEGQKKRQCASIVCYNSPLQIEIAPTGGVERKKHE